MNLTASDAAAGMPGSADPAVLYPDLNVDVADLSMTAQDFESLSPAQQLQLNTWLQHNITQMLNISLDNLTSLLMMGIGGAGASGVFQPNGSTAMTTTLQQHEPQMAQRDSMPLLATLTVCYALIFVAGVLGNMITCIVISRNRFMHTATNFYLFNLAVSDLILLFSGMPQELYNLWYPDAYPFTDVLCILESVLSETAANATVLTITAFTVERYIAICHPFRQHTMSKLSRAVKFIVAIWVMAFWLALPQAMQFSVEPQVGGTSCTMKDAHYAHWFAVSGFIFFCGPMTAICVLYVLIGVKLKRSRLLQALPRRCYDVNRGISAQSRVIRMLVAVAVAFFLCWAPFHAQRLMAVYGTMASDSEIYNEIFHILNYTSGVLYFLSTCINPLLYNIMSHKFREAFKVTLARHFGLAGQYQTQHHNYSALLRQNGSMRLHTTVNNNALLEHFSSCRVVQFQSCRHDPSHHLSLQDSIRTTTTTTTISGGGGGGVGGFSAGSGKSSRSSNRNRCISAGSQATLMTSLSKNDVFAANNVAACRPNSSSSMSADVAPTQHRILRTQISQLSSVGDANSLLEVDMGGGSGGGNNYNYYPRSSAGLYRQQNLRRLPSVIGGNNDTANIASADDCHSIDSREWSVGGEEQNMELSRSAGATEHETELITKPVALPVTALIMSGVATSTTHLSSPMPAMNSIAELNEPTRSRLKLSRITIRRPQSAFVRASSPRVELMRTHLPGMGHATTTLSELSPPSNNNSSNKKSKPRKSAAKTLDSLTDKFHWRLRRKLPHSAEAVHASGKRVRQESSSSSSTSSGAGNATPKTALMRGGGAYASTGATMETTDLTTMRNGSMAFAAPQVL